MTNWVVWAGEPIQDIVERDGFVGIGFGGAKLGDISLLAKDVVRERVVRARGYDTDPDDATRQLVEFRDNIQVGDCLLVPLQTRGAFHIGEVTGPYEFVESRLFPHCRSVKWHRTNIPRSSLGFEINRRTVHRPKLHAAAFDRYIEEQMSSMDEGNPLWDNFIARAQAYVGSGRLDEEEVNYKLDIGDRVQAARLASLDRADGWQKQLHAALGCNFIRWGVIYDFRTWCIQRPDDALAALSEIWAEDGPDDLDDLVDQIRMFSNGFPREVKSGVGTRLNLISGLLMGVDAEQCPPFQVSIFDEAYRLTGYEPPPKGADEAALYKHALGFLNKFIEEASARGLDLRHRLDAQSIAWVIVKGRDRVDDDAPDGETGEPHPPPPPTLEALADSLFLPSDFLEEVEGLLREKPQVIFYGPPGTGKTYVAKALAEHLAGDPDRVTLVQFHPSYAYEDFVQGYRPTLDGDRAGFRIADGPLVEAAKRAKEEDDADHFLIIDEINRGNLAKVFGELYFLLEYREEQRMRLQYSDKPFSLPDNLYIIGTMNTADRSIARVDLALRRRFYFVEFHPDEPPVRGLLARFLEGNDLQDMEWVASFVNEANKELGDHEAAIGPSYFMNPDLDEDMARRVWKHAIRPYIEERLQDERDDARSERLKRFDALWARRSGDAPPATDEPSDEGSSDGGVEEEAAASQ